jgi:crotonobetaine/carnitine-CoA ligase
MSANRLEVVLACYACAYAGLIQVPLNTAHVGTFLEHQFTVAAPGVAVIEVEYAERLVRSEAARRCVRRVYLLPASGDVGAALMRLRAAGFDAGCWEELLAGEASTESLEEAQAHEPAAILFTSGTTGPSKGVTLSHKQLHWVGEEQIDKLRLTSADVYLSSLPMFHAAAQVNVLSPCLIAGCQLVMYPKFSASSWLTWIREHQITVTFLIGVMMEFVYRQPATALDADNRLRCVQANPTAWTIVEDFKRRFGIEHVTESIGQTEIASPISTPYASVRPAGAVGLLVDDWYDVRIVDDEDREVAPGEPGEYIVRAKEPWITTLGYYNMPEATLAATRNLWFHTGDRLRRDDEGWYYFVDRVSDSLRRRGENISAHEIEVAVLAHDGVRSCAVVAVSADVDGGEDEVLAAVVVKEGASVTAEDLWRLCEATVPQFAIPRYVRFLPELPQTHTSKVNKARLREEGVTATTADRVTSQGQAGTRRARS